jgi:hypothetical protein
MAERFGLGRSGYWDGMAHSKYDSIDRRIALAGDWTRYPLSGSVQEFRPNRR